jgi:hypothetical protein
MLYALYPESCAVVWAFGCGECVLYCMVEVREGMVVVWACLVLGENRACCLQGSCGGCYVGVCVGFHPRLWRLCGSGSYESVEVRRCIGSDCGRMSGHKSLRGRILCMAFSLIR